ncbi:hypothetical protein D7V88_24475 [Corallococcus terminator]|uniref:Uncharacterized protein n=1 Tax=Corallococcus terminator TaxID=2316733 RepID=A0A3A8IT69_9BACT|nr:hypothetical protein D7V88_24475 [Corallococcus terminator]
MDADAPKTVATLPPVPFKEHPAQLYTGRLAKPDFARADADVKLYRSRIRDAAATGVKFGGRYGVMISGCGTECIFGFVIDATNGHVLPLPASGEGHRMLQLAFRPDSRVLRALWKASEPDACALQDFVIDAGQFRSVKKEVLPGICPEMNSETGESTGEPYW